MIFIIFIGFTLLSWLISSQLKKRFKEYSKIPTANGMSGRDVVEKMLIENGVSGVKIGSVSGRLSDHYNPINKTINRRLVNIIMLFFIVIFSSPHPSVHLVRLYLHR